MKNIRRTTIVATLLIVAGVGFAACGEDDPTPRVENRPSQAETTAAVESETAQEFIRRWFKASEDMQNTGETDAYLAMSKECTSCQDLADDVSSFYGSGGWIKYEGNTLGPIEVVPGSNRYRVGVTAGPTAYKTASAAPTEAFDGGSVEFIVTLQPDGKSWQVLAAHQVAS